MTHLKENTEDEITLKHLVQKLQQTAVLLKSRWIYILIVASIGGIVGYINAYLKKPLYIAELTFVLEGEKQSPLAAYSGIATQFGLGSGSGGNGGIFAGQNMLALMKSRKMIEKTLLSPVNVDGEVISLAEFYIKINGFRKIWTEKSQNFASIQFLPDADPTKFTIDQNRLMSSFHSEIIGNNLVVGTMDKTPGINILKVTSENEVFSKLFVESLTKNVADFYIETKTKKSTRDIAILQNQADSVRREFNTAISAVATSIDANPNANAARQRLNLPSQRRQIDAQANQAILLELIKNIESTKMFLRGETPLIQIVDAPVLPLDKKVSSRTMGMAAGFVLGGILSSCFFIMRFFLKN